MLKSGHKLIEIVLWMGALPINLQWQILFLDLNQICGHKCSSGVRIFIIFLLYFFIVLGMYVTIFVLKWYMFFDAVGYSVC